MSATSTRWRLPEPVATLELSGVRAGWQRVLRALALRRAGWIVLALAVIAAALGWPLGWLELRVVAVASVLLVAVALLFTIGKPTLQAQLVLPERSVVVGQPASVSLGVRNAGPSRHWGSRLVVPTGDHAAILTVPLLAPGQDAWEKLRLPTARRGVVTVGPVSSMQGDPFGLAGRETQWTQQYEFFVHPVTVTLPGRLTGFVHDVEGHTSAHLTMSDMNFHALREYVPGDDRRHIHWRSSARAGQLMVRQFEESRQSRVALAMDTARASWLGADEFELGVSCVGSLAIHTLQSEAPLGLWTSTQQLSALTTLGTLDGLCRVEPTPAGGLANLVETLSLREPGASVVVCITGSTYDVPAMHRALSRCDVDARVVGIVVRLGSELRVRAVGQTAVVQIGQLPDLPRAMRKALQ